MLVLLAFSSLIWGWFGNFLIGVKIFQECEKSRRQRVELEIRTNWRMVGVREFEEMEEYIQRVRRYEFVFYQGVVQGVVSCFFFIEVLCCGVFFFWGFYGSFFCSFQFYFNLILLFFTLFLCFLFCLGDYLGFRIYFVFRFVLGQVFRKYIIEELYEFLYLVFIFFYQL